MQGTGTLCVGNCSGQLPGCSGRSARSASVDAQDRDHSRQRLTQFARQTPGRNSSSDGSDVNTLLAERLEELEYLVERESATISSCLELVSHEDAGIQANLTTRRDVLVEGLQRAGKVRVICSNRFCRDVISSVRGHPSSSTPENYIQERIECRM